jgi:hypothetical protein
LFRASLELVLPVAVAVWLSQQRNQLSWDGSMP